MTESELHEEVVLPSELSTVDAIEAKSEEFARKAGFDEDTASQISMISREAAANAVLHGNRKDPNKRVRAKFSLTSENLTIQVADEGEGFDSSAIPDPLSPEGLLKPSGRGIFLMRAIMDEVNFRQLNPGTEITLVKHRNRE
ncbi:MAG TPA: ATP-binding protein [Candidatus Aquilonibacter sp.]|nr:ATP-binding protein [Candidatus Aquilonibacter sp.]